MNFIDYYEVLQISPTAQSEIIKAAYRQLSKIYHPDVSNFNEKKFILIKEAYDVLSDKSKRYDYDVLWRENKRGNDYTEEANMAQENPSIPLHNYKRGNPSKWIGLAIILFGLVLYGGYKAIPSKAETAPVNIAPSSLPKEDFAKIKTTAYILDYGEAYFDIYNGTDFKITGITLEINIKNENGDTIETRKFHMSVNIYPLTTDKEIHLTTGIEGLPKVGENDLRIQSKYISWSYTDIAIESP